MLFPALNFPMSRTLHVVPWGYVEGGVREGYL
jgi:hypothetical protein